MTDSPQLPSIDAVRQNLVVVRKKGVNSIGQVEVPALRRCAIAAGSGDSKTTAKDLENVITSSIDRLDIDGERDALNILFGIRSEVRRTSLTVRREKAARVLFVTADGFRRHKEYPLIKKLAESISEYCEERLAHSTAKKSAKSDGDSGAKRSGKNSTSQTSSSAWARWWARVNRRIDRSARRLARSPKWAVFVGLLTALAAVASIIAVVIRDAASQTPVQTDVIYVAGHRFFDFPYESTPGEAFCGNSPASNRSDAYLCLIPGPDGTTRIKLDPCFAVIQGAVACPSLGREKKYTKWHAPVVAMPEVNAVPPWVEPWPYEVILNDGTSCLSITGLVISTPEANTHEMIFGANEETPNNPIFRCDIQPSPVVAFGWTFADDGLLETVKWIEDPKYYKSQIGGLSLENSVYYGLYSPSPGASFGRVSIATVVV
ncbi:hypothetical protein [Nocardia sp. MW-W600-9]